MAVEKVNPWAKLVRMLQDRHRRQLEAVRETEAQLDQALKSEKEWKP